MQAYRVLMQDTHNGESFNFAVNVRAMMLHFALDKAKGEFPEAKVVSIARVISRRI